MVSEVEEEVSIVQAGFTLMSKTASSIFVKPPQEVLASILNLPSLYIKSYFQNSTLVTFSLAKQIIQRTILSTRKKTENLKFIQISVKGNLTVYSVINHMLPNILLSKF